MFWKKPPKSDLSKPGTKISREELIAQAKANVAAAREELGEENIARMRAILLAQEEKNKPQPYRPPNAEPTPAEQAKELIKKMDKAKVADYIRTLSREDD